MCVNQHHAGFAERFGSSREFAPVEITRQFHDFPPRRARMGG